MPGPSPLVASPVLIGRDDLLALADARLAATAAGSGGLLLVAGEAGIGKTRLLGAVGRRAERDGFAVLRAAAFPGDAEASGGVLLDLAGDLQRFDDDAVRAVGRAVAGRLRAPGGTGEDPNRRRRLLEQSLADDLAGLPTDRPLLMVLEDLHWADQLSLDVVARLATRLPYRPALVLGAYRSDELYPGTPIRAWRGRLLSSRLAEEIRPPRLTAEQTAVLTSAVLGRAAPGDVVTAIHDRSDGIPLHIEELLAASGGDGTDVGAVGVPDTLADAVLRRMEVLGRGERDVAAAAAVIGRSFDFDLLTEVVDEPDDVVDAALRRLQDMYLVQAGAGTSFDFRHALIRDAVHADVSRPRRRQLHERVGRAGAERGYPATFVSAHFEQAGLREEAHRHAHVAAARAAGLSAHREALQLYRRAVRTMPADLAPADRADLWAALGDEAAAADDNAAASEAFTEARRLWSESGDRLAAAAVVPRLAAVTHLLGDGLDRRAPLLQRALDSLDGVPGAERVKGQLLSALSAVYMLDRRLDESLAHGTASRELSQASGDDRTDLDTAATVGAVLLFAGRMSAGWNLLETTVSRARELRYEAEAARAYRMIATSASVLVEYDRAEHWLDEGIAYAEAVELGNHRSYLAAHLAHVQWAPRTAGGRR